jgi:RNA polymerase sigma factor (sigma-70 family)
MDDAQLVARTRRGSREAARPLAEEIAQDAFARAFAALDRFDETRPLGPWLRKIALNRAIDELRHERRLALVEPPRVHTRRR